MEAGDLLDSVKFSDGVKKPSGQDHAAAEGNYVIKASCRKKEARKTEMLKGNPIDPQKGKVTDPLAVR